MRSVLASTLVTLLLISALVPRSTVTRYEFPLLAGVDEPKEETKQVSATSSDTAAGLPWLHVVVETKYAWIYQKSIGRAWTTVSRDDTTRVNVGELCIQLEAYGKHTLCETDTSYLEVVDMKRRVAVKKKNAVVSAWATDPVLDSVTVEMMP